MHLQLDDVLHLCLLAVQHRFPHHRIVITAPMSELREVHPGAWSALPLIAALRGRSPDLLQAPARLLITDQSAEISLIGDNEDTPAFSIRDEEKGPLSMQGGGAVSAIECRHSLQVR